MPTRPALPRARAWSRLAGWLGRVPSQCAVCHRWPDQPVCGACLARFGSPRPRCPGCALAWAPVAGVPALCPDCLRQPLPLDGCLAAFDYGYPWSGLLAQFKFRQQTGWAGFFARQLLARPEVRQALAGLGADDWLLPLPLSDARLAERGFNQAWELARALHRLGGCAARPDARLLLRLRDTAPQSALGRGQRLGNLRGAFLVDPLRAPALSGRAVLLVDDVMTTGASLATAAQALKAAGARSVTGLVVARTPP